MGDSRFPRRARLTSQAEFDAVFKRGERRKARLFRAHLLVSDSARLGIAVPKRIAPRASERNRVRRIVRERFRHRRDTLPPYAMVVIALPGAIGASAAALALDLEHLFDLIAALKPPHSDGTIAR